MDPINNRQLPYTQAMVRLLQGAIYNDTPKLWNELLLHQYEINKYFEQIGLELIVEHKDGYAFLQQVTDEEGKTIGLIRRMPLTYEQTLLCVLLREWMDEFEINDTESRNLYIVHKEFRERIEIFFKETPNQVKLFKNLDSLIRDMIELDFLKKVNEGDTLQENLYEVRRIIKSKISSDQLETFKQKLINHVNL
ncbi:MAG: DUF4194 domain-containing protein [Tannerellaceae bacterium]